MQVNVAGLRRNLKNIACNYSEAQIKVREATSNDPYNMPSAIILSEIAELTFNVLEFPKIMEMIWRRLNDTGKNWRHVNKALILMEHLIKTGIGVEKCVKQCKENIFAIEALQEFVYYEDGKDYGKQVREKANQLVNLLRDSELLRRERCQALKANERFARFASGFGYNDVLHPCIESMRPKTFVEEQTQIKLALDISREEAQQELLKRRTDDIRLNLALEQSERDFKERETRDIKKEPQSYLLDLLDISLGPACSSRDATCAKKDESILVPWSQNQHIDPWQPLGNTATNINTLVSTSLEPASSTNDASYDWLSKNTDALSSAWPSPALQQPLSGCVRNGDNFSNPAAVNTTLLQEQFSSNRYKNNFFENFEGTTTPSFVTLDQSVAENTNNTHNADPSKASSSNPFL